MGAPDEVFHQGIYIQDLAVEHTDFDAICGGRNQPCSPHSAPPLQPRAVAQVFRFPLEIEPARVFGKAPRPKH